jgi:hypothetical protein
VCMREDQVKAGDYHLPCASTGIRGPVPVFKMAEVVVSSPI